MVRQRVQAGARAADIKWSWWSPRVLPGDVDALIFAKGGEWDAAGSALSFSLGVFLGQMMALECLGVFQGSFAHGTEGPHGACQRETKDPEDGLHLGESGIKKRSSSG